MKNLLIVSYILIISINFIISFKKTSNLRNSHKNINHKQIYYTPNVTPITTVNIPINSQNIYSNSPINQNNLYTPLTTGTFSSGGNIYQTNASAIPYGTGYSYGQWQKIPTK
jgi:hypothetical protein